MGIISNDHVDIDMLKTGNITFSKTPSVYQKDEYYRIEERKDGDIFMKWNTKYTKNYI